jgi:hypothetical protein
LLCSERKRERKRERKSSRKSVIVVLTDFLLLRERER